MSKQKIGRDDETSETGNGKTLETDKSDQKEKDDTTGGTNSLQEKDEDKQNVGKHRIRRE